MSMKLRSARGFSMTLNPLNFDALMEFCMRFFATFSLFSTYFSSVNFVSNYSINQVIPVPFAFLGPWTCL